MARDGVFEHAGSPFLHAPGSGPGAGRLRRLPARAPCGRQRAWAGRGGPERPPDRRPRAPPRDPRGAAAPGSPPAAAAADRRPQRRLRHAQRGADRRLADSPLPGAASGLPRSAEGRRPDDARRTARLPLLPGGAAEDARRVRRHDRGGERDRPRSRSRRSALRPHRRDAKHPRRLRGRHGGWNRHDERERRRSRARSAYPPVVAAVVFATANHYVLDAVAGGALALASLRVARLFDFS